MDLLQLVELGHFNPISTSRNIKFAKLKTLSLELGCLMPSLRYPVIHTLIITVNMTETNLHIFSIRPSKLAFGKKSTEKVKKIEILCRWANCSFKAGTTFKLKDHLKSHSAERTVACPDCGGLFASRSKFFDHCTRQLKVDKGLKCSYCQKTFPTERLLRDHMRSHINHFQCPLCNMTCPSATALNKHVTYRHTDERAFVCPFKAEEEDEEDSCDYSAKTQNDLNKHLR